MDAVGVVTGRPGIDLPSSCMGAYLQGRLSCDQTGAIVQEGFLPGSRHEISVRWSIVDNDKELDRDEVKEATLSYTYFRSAARARAPTRIPRFAGQPERGGCPPLPLRVAHAQPSGLAGVRRSHVRRERRVGGVEMAESCTVAFGRYLRILRERRGLSLEEVSSMSRSLADPVNKGYLSRCENGRHGVGFSKIVTLSRIYGVPTEVLAERMELDTELDRIGGPETAGLTFAELQKRAVAASSKGAFWETYAYFRDGLPMARSAELSASFRDAAEQFACTQMNISTAAGSLGRSRFALHELECVERSGQLSERHHPALLELLSSRYRVSGQLDKAHQLAAQAIREAEDSGRPEYAGYAYGNSARLAYEDREFGRSISLCQKAYRLFRQAGNEEECARTLANLAQVYFDAGRLKSARRSVAAAERIAKRLARQRTRALLRILLGEIEEAEERPNEAVRHWREALEIAKELNDKILQFKAEFPLFRHAVARGDDAMARAFERRLRRLSIWVPAHVEEHAAFVAMSPRNHSDRKRVPRPQRLPFAGRNS